MSKIVYRLIFLESEGTGYLRKVMYIASPKKIMDMEEMSKECDEALQAIPNKTWKLSATLDNGERPNFYWELPTDHPSYHNYRITSTMKEGQNFVYMTGGEVISYMAYSNEEEIKSQSSDSPDYEFIYEGTFINPVTLSKKTIKKTYIKKRPLVLNDWLIQDFANESLINKEVRKMELVGISYVCSKKIHESQPQLKWVRVHDVGEQKECLCWIPALFINGKIHSAAGELLSSDDPNDVKEFLDFPFEGYKIVKV